MTLEKVAKRAGVSVSTASKALSNGKDISDETKELVRRAAEELGYFSQSKKRKLDNRSSAHPTVALICPEIISIHYSETVTSLCRLIEERGGRASVFITGFDKEKLKNMIDRCIYENEISAAICIDNTKEHGSLPFPMIYLSRVEGENCVFVDLEGVVGDAANYLYSKGHRKIGFVGERLTLGKQRVFCEYMEKTAGGYDEKLIFCEEGRFEVIGNNAAVKILEMPKEKRPTALLAAYDEVAYGLMHTLRSGGVRIPDEISVMGINDIPASRFLDTPLTTLRVPTEELAECAVDMLFDVLSGKQTEKKSICVECKIIERASVKIFDT